MKVFSIRKMIEDDYHQGLPDSYLYEWSLDCDGKTPEECTEMALLTDIGWLIEKEYFVPTSPSQYVNLLKEIDGKDYLTVCTILEVPARTDYVIPPEVFNVGDKVEVLDLHPFEREWGVDFLIGATGTITEHDPISNGQDYLVTFDEIMPLDDDLNTQAWWLSATNIKKIK